MRLVRFSILVCIYLDFVDAFVLEQHPRLGVRRHAAREKSSEVRATKTAFEDGAIGATPFTSTEPTAQQPPSTTVLREQS